MTHLRKIMLEEVQRRNFAACTIEYYLRVVEGFAGHFGKPPDRLGRPHRGSTKPILLRKRKLEPRTVRLHVAALRFFFVETLKRPYRSDEIPYPKAPRQLPVVLTVEEVGRLLDGCPEFIPPHHANGSLLHRYAKIAKCEILQVPRYRQPIDADSHPVRQRRSRPLRSPQPEATRNLARVL